MNHDVNVKVDTSALDSKFQQVKQHFRENKKTYLVGVGSALVGAAVMGRGAQIVDGFKLVHVQWKSPNVYNVALTRRGHPGFIVKCIETGETFASQGRAAEACGISSAALSQHLNGMKAHAQGLHFERLGEAV